MLRTKITGSRPAWLGHTVFGFCAAHDKSEPAREDASPPTTVPHHTRILWRHRIPVPRSNAERRSLARVPEPTPQGRLRPITPRFAKNASLEASLQKNRHNSFITSRYAHHITTSLYITSHAPTDPTGVGAQGIWKKSYVHFNFSQWWSWTRPQPKSLDFGHLPVVNSRGEPNFAIFFQLTVRADFDAGWRI